MSVSPAPAQEAGPAPLILTAALSPDAFDWFNDRRRACYPPERNKVPAHLTLFHHLPSDLEAEIEDALAEASWRLDPLPAEAEKLRFIGQGVQVAVKADGLSALRAQFAERWRHVLVPQDLRPHRPHVTLQNKVPAERARRTFDALCATFQPFAFEIEGLQLWRYRGGPWEPVGAFAFGGAPT